jgi:hypothetical protein
MKIVLPDSFIKIISDKTVRSVLKILEVRNNSTMIDIKGHRFDVPFVLKKDSSYHAVIKDGVLNIIENKQEKNVESKKESYKELLDSIFQIKEIKNNDLIMNFLILFQNMLKPEKDKKENHRYFQDKKGAFVFIFDLNLFDNSVKLFVRLLNKNICLFFYNSLNGRIDELILSEFKKNLKMYINDKYEDMNLEIMFFDKKEKFYDNISVFMTDIDIKI